MKTDVLLVEKRALFCVKASRILSVEWASDARNPDLVQRRIREGEADYGPFTDRFRLVPNTAYLEPRATNCVGMVDESADIPLATESGVEA
jgi:hypothetical protein